MVELGAGELALLGAAGLLAGMVNAVAGGGSLISFPALLAVGYSPLAANVTNIVAMLPGYGGSALAYRSDLSRQRHRARALGVAGAVGGAVGAGLLLVSPAALFETLVPFLVLAACALLAVQPLIPSADGGEDRSGTTAMVGLASVYGGYFGAALGVVLLAILGLMTSEGIQSANGLKAALSLMIGLVSAAMLAVLGPVAWLPAGLMAVASLVGGRVGGAFARRLPADVLRWTVVAIGTAIAVRFLV